LAQIALFHQLPAAGQPRAESSVLLLRITLESMSLATGRVVAAPSSRLEGAATYMSLLRKYRCRVFGGNAGCRSAYRTARLLVNDHQTTSRVHRRPGLLSPSSSARPSATPPRMRTPGHGDRTLPHAYLENEL